MHQMIFSNQKRNEKMALLDANSVSSTKTELDIFSVPATQVVVKNGHWEELHPINPVTNEGPYEFHLPPNLHMLQLSKNYVYMQLRIRHASITDLVAANNPLVVPINLIGSTFFKQVKLYINGKLVSNSGDKYANRSYFEKQCNFVFNVIRKC